MADELRMGHLRGIVMRAPGMTETREFYTDLWGLSIAHEADGIVYLRGTGAEPFIYGLKDDDTYGIEYIHFGQPDRQTVDAFHAQVVARGGTVLGDPAPIDGPFGGYGFEILDPDNRRLRVTADLEMRTPDDVFAYPRKISHVVLNTAQMDTVRPWYERVLGFRTSDYYVGDQMVFLRCSTDHHSIALVRNRYPAVNHVAFEMAGIDDYMRGIGRMKQKGQVPTWGPGRHGPGNNPFAYFVSPSGFMIEFVAELAQIDEATHQVKEWSYGDPEAADRWMTAGPPTPAQRTVMAGRPDPGFPLKD